MAGENSRPPRTQRYVLFEGQMRFTFVAEVAAASAITDYKMILIDCGDATRIDRLAFDRRAGRSLSSTMLNWVQYLRDEAKRLCCPFLNTTHVPLEACVEQVWVQLNQ